MKIRRKIKLSLDNIDEFIRELEEYRVWIDRKSVELTKRLCERGVEIAKQICPVDTGELRDSINAVAEGLAGQIIAASGHAAYVEFGTGIVGAMSQHPSLPWIYDINGHGFEGWVYPKNDRLYWTSGQPSRPFMYKMARQLAKEAPKIAKEVFSE